MKIEEALSMKSIGLNLDCGSKGEVIEKLIELASNSGNVIDSKLAHKEVLNRESVMSTGIGGGIALPHAKTNAVDNLVASVATLNSPIDFDSLDNNNVEIVFLLLSNENNIGQHLRFLSKISRMLNDDTFKKSLVACQQESDALDLFKNFE